MTERKEAVIRSAYKAVLGRDADAHGLEAWSGRLKDDSFETIVQSLINSDEFQRNYLLRQTRARGFDAARDINNWLVHFLIGKPLHELRLKLVQTIVPAGAKVLDLGGASGSRKGALLEMGYPHARDLTIIDLPLDIRMKPGPDVQNEFVEQGVAIRYSYHSMADLSFYPDDSFDLIWSGQTFEHITEAEGEALFPQIKRVLKPGGWFALDTPNRTVTQVMTGPDRYIHAEHKIEYAFYDFLSRFARAGLELRDTLGLLNMPLTISSDYAILEELRMAGINKSPGTSYVFYAAFQKATA